MPDRGVYQSNHQRTRLAAEAARTAESARSPPHSVHLLQVKDLRSHSSDTVLAKLATRVLDYNHWDGGRFAANKTAVVLESIPTEPENRGP